MARNPSGLCKCGCGIETAKATTSHVRFGYELGESIEFVKGHHRRKQPFPTAARQRMSEAAKERFARDGHPALGYKHTEATKRQMSASMKARIEKDGHPRKGSKATAEQRRAQSERVRREKHPNWRGGRYKRRDGYIDVLVEEGHPMHSMVRRDGYCFEHRLVMAEKLGRPLASTEHVHHRNGIRDDNQPENLTAMSLSEHSRLNNMQVTTAKVERIAAALAQGLSPAEVAVLVTEERLNT